MDDPSPKHSKPTTFAAHYYGSLDISEDRLVKGKCVLVVIDCLNALLHSATLPHEVLYMGELRRVSAAAGCRRVSLESCKTKYIEDMLQSNSGGGQPHCPC